MYNLNKSLTIEKCDNIYINKSYLKKEKKNNIKKIISLEQNNLNDNNKIKNNLNEQIKIKKNNKLIFMNKSLIKDKTKIKDFKEKKHRSSLYRGVSKNGKKWQTIVSYKKNYQYYGVYPTEEFAARVYDIISIKNKGIKAKTNFIYDLHQIQKISETNIFNSDNINENVIKLIKEL